MNWRSEEIAETAAEVRARHEDNRIAWNEGAQRYTEANDVRVQRLKAGKSNLHRIERVNLARCGPLHQWCRRAIHLQCAIGYHTLSLLLEGAHEVVGVDISEVHIANARWTSTQLQMPAHWNCCDVLDTPATLNATADLVYTGRGALCWIHDLKSWAAVIARLLRPGGVLSVFDDHPVSRLFSQETSTLAASVLDYFAHADANQGWSAEYIGDLDKPVAQHALKHEGLWTIADIFQALVTAGLLVEYLGEHPDEYWPAFTKLAEQEKVKLPMTFSMIAKKP